MFSLINNRSLKKKSQASVIKWKDNVINYFVLICIEEKLSDRRKKTF